MAMAGIDVHVCADGCEALRLCRTIGPQTVLLDVHMPGIDGLEVARRLRSDPAHANLRLVAITGEASWALRKMALEAGFDEFLGKPVPIDVLIGVLAPSRRGA